MKNEILRKYLKREITPSLAKLLWGEFHPLRPKDEKGIRDFDRSLKAADTP